jgi:hypothetical protein
MHQHNQKMISLMDTFSRDWKVEAKPLFKLQPMTTDVVKPLRGT